MTVYHVTGADAAGSIEAHGFRDSHGTYLTDSEHIGAWVSDSPLTVQSGIEDPVVFEIDVPMEVIAEFEWIEEGKGYREWLVPAVVLNSYPRRRVDS